MNNPSLSIAIVTHCSSLTIFKKVIDAILIATNKTQKQNRIAYVELTIVDNSLISDYSNNLKIIADKYQNKLDKIEVVILKNNKGYGHAHNLTLKKLDSDYHMVMNPDVIIDSNAITNAIEYMDVNQDVGMISPYAETENLEKLFLLKHYPPIFILFVRGFFPALCSTQVIKKNANDYEMRDIDQDKPYQGVDIASGCFMFFRTSAIKNKFKFSEKFFLYFEDFDLTWQFSMVHKIAYVPSVKIVHYGGNAARKGGLHIFYFIRSAITFYNRFGWKFF